jgi:hypothetical protein
MLQYAIEHEDILLVKKFLTCGTIPDYKTASLYFVDNIDITKMLLKFGKGVTFALIVVAGLRIAQDRLTYWQGVGAQASPTVERLIRQAGKAAA